MLEPTKEAIPGCLHSEMPEMIVANTRGMEDEEGAKGDLASSLYFKRCDERFKNIKGDLLECG